MDASRTIPKSLLTEKNPPPPEPTTPSSALAFPNAASLKVACLLCFEDPSKPIPLTEAVEDPLGTPGASAPALTFDRENDDSVPFPVDDAVVGFGESEGVPRYASTVAKSSLAFFLSRGVDLLRGGITPCLLTFITSCNFSGVVPDETRASRAASLKETSRKVRGKVNDDAFAFS